MGNILSKFLNLFQQNKDEFDSFSWQDQLEELLLSQPNVFNIYWLVINKDTSKMYNFMHYMAKNYQAIVATASGSTMKFIVAEFICSNGYEPKIILIDAATKMKFKNINYSGIEELKNGYFNLSRGSLRTIFIESPHIVVFAAEEPNNDPNSKYQYQVVYLN